MVVGSGIDCDVLKQILKINVLRSVELDLERAGTCVCYAVIESKLSSRCSRFPPIETAVHDFMLKPTIENERSRVSRILWPICSLERLMPGSLRFYDPIL